MKYSALRMASPDGVTCLAASGEAPPATAAAPPLAGDLTDPSPDMVRRVHNGDKIDPASLSEATIRRILGVAPRYGTEPATPAEAPASEPEPGWSQPRKHLLALLERHHRLDLPLPGDRRLAELCGYSGHKSCQRRLRDLVRQGVATLELRAGRRYVSHFDPVKADL